MIVCVCVCLLFPIVYVVHARIFARALLISPCYCMSVCNFNKLFLSYLFRPHPFTLFHTLRSRYMARALRLCGPHLPTVLQLILKGIELVLERDEQVWGRQRRKEEEEGGGGRVQVA